MPAPSFETTLFPTEIGRCAVVWRGPRIAGTQLPERDDAATKARVAARFPGVRDGAPPRGVKRAIAAMTALLRGKGGDLSAIALDLDPVPPFHRRVYEAARAIPIGGTASYGELAARLGSPGAARAVGQAMRKNPFAIVVPCHRVMAAGGKVGGFSATGGTTTKLRMLALERAGATRRGGHFSFDAETALAHLAAADRRLARIIDETGPFAMRLKATNSLFVALAEAIVYQQLSGKAAATIFGRVCALWPRGLAARTLLDTPDAALCGAGLSQNKLRSLRDLAARTLDGRLPTLAAIARMDDDAIVERLVSVRGVGRWTAQMLLMFRLGRPDVLPVDDLGVRKGFAVTFRKSALPTAAALEAHAERWRPYRSVACWYLWRAAETAA